MVREVTERPAVWSDEDCPLVERRVCDGEQAVDCGCAEAGELPVSMSDTHGKLRVVFDTLSWEARLALRRLARTPGMSVVTVVLMALGIAATTTMFSLTYGVLLKPLPWPEPDRVVRLQETRGANTGRVPWTITNTTYHAWQDRATTVDAVGGWTRTRLASVTIAGGEPERLRTASVTPSLFRVIGIRPMIGRLFSDEEVNQRLGVIVLGFDTWQRRFGGRADVLGQALRVDGSLLTVIGVLPPQFDIPDREADAWVPLRIPRVEPGAASIAGMIFNAVARLRPGATPDQASAEATARARSAPSLREAGVALFGSDGRIDVTAASAREALTAEVRPALLILLAAVALLFATALGSMLLIQSSRAVRRRREMAIQVAVGASRGRLAGGWLVENTVLGVAGGVSGIMLSLAFHRLLPVILPADFPRVDAVLVNAPIATFAAALTLVATFACGAMAALLSRDRNLRTMLASDVIASGTTGASSHGQAVRATLIVVQVAIACVLLVGTGLLTRSFAALLSADRGFNPANVISAYGTRPGRPLATDAAALERAQQRLAALPGVTHAAFANALPFVTTGGLRGLTLRLRDNPASAVQVQTLLRVVSPEYFAAIGLRLLAGRTFDGSDVPTSRPVVVVNRTFATKYLPAMPIGATIPATFGSRSNWEVIGVVDDMRQGGLRNVPPSRFGGVTDPPEAEMFFIYRQWDWDVAELAYVLRSTGDPERLAPELRAIVNAENPSTSIEAVATLQDLLMESLARPRTYALLIGGFALFATLVAVVGLFGVLSLMAAQRTREIGVRVAMGARPSDVVRLISRQAATVTVIGLTVGLATAAMLARLLSGFLYGVTAADPATFAAIGLGLLFAAVTACAAPAYRAARIDPVIALRG